MKIINANFEVINEPDIIKKIELVARTCYKSENNIGDGTDIKMIKNLIENKHTAMLEHGNVIIQVSEYVYKTLQNSINNNNILFDCENVRNNTKKNYLRFTQCKVPSDEIEGFMETSYFHIFNGKDIRYIISGNLRAWIETLTDIYEHKKADVSSRIILPLNEILKAETKGAFSLPDVIYYPEESSAEEFTDDCSMAILKNMDILSIYERMVHETMTVKFTIDRGITHELVRMRECSFAQESTRYCNYSKDKFGNEITFIKPYYYDIPERIDEYNTWTSAMKDAETHYFNLLNAGSTPQEARSVLPCSVKSDIVVTANLREWCHIFELRALETTGSAHPQMKEVMLPLFEEFYDTYSSIVKTFFEPLYDSYASAVESYSKTLSHN